ncbi:hypothetical protein HC031_07325 [Planosporangium thailandense]|uniref:Uncharacterized protein n=1 Tax=Planosporangium thailandense TaxID=765197 RepID=A0ABX0XUH4_9ACTN|nr:hypothetical protein [Planosporangium thailandense]NJC69532.1 hypothetical protein [Planosporangium thailandense]
MAKTSIVIGITIRLFLLVMAVWLTVSVVVPTRDPLALDVVTVVVLAVVALIGPARRFLLASVVGRRESRVRLGR